MKWINENKGKLLVTVAVIFFLITASLSSVRTVDDGVNDTGAERGVQRLTADVQVPFSRIFDAVGDFFSNVFNSGANARENEKLKEENASLREQLSRAELSDSQLKELQELSNALNYSSYADSYDKVTADVISLDQSGVFGIMTVSAGSSDGVKKGNLVINEDGMVGRVASVSKNSCKVSGVIDSTMSVSFYVKDDEETLGIVTGDGEGGLSGYIFDNTKNISKNAVLMTSGQGRYPGGIEIGKVKSVKRDKSTSQINFTADSSVDFYSARVVTVLVQK